MKRLFSTLVLCAGLLFAQIAGPLDSLDKAQAAEKEGDWSKAESIYKSILQKHRSADVYQRLGLVQHLQNKFAEAASSFKSALQLDQELWTAHLFLGIDDYRINLFAESLDHLNASYRLRPDQPETRFWIGAAHLALHQYLDGLEQLEVVIEKDPGNADALRLLAESYADYGTRLLNQVAEQYPESAPGLQVQARALEFEGSYDAALQFYRQAAAKDPNRPGIQEAITRLHDRKQ